MQTLIIVLTSISAYFLIGYRLAKAGIAANWIRAEEQWCGEDTQRESVQMQYILMLLFWPAMILWRIAVNASRKAIGE